MIEPSEDFRYPDDEPDNQKVNLYREASRKFLRVMNLSICEVLQYDKNNVKGWAVAYALGLAVCEGVSLSDRAAALGMTPQGLSKHVREFLQTCGLDGSAYCYNKKKTKQKV